MKIIVIATDEEDTEIAYEADADSVLVKAPGQRVDTAELISTVRELTNTPAP